MQEVKPMQQEAKEDKTDSLSGGQNVALEVKAIPF